MSGGERVVVVGGGPGAFMAAEVLASAGCRVEVFEGAVTPGRKFLIAGRGGLNLTHSEPLDDLLDRYGPERVHLEPMIRGFTPDDLRHWCAGLDEPTIVGTSGRVFPHSMRATRLFANWRQRLDSLGVSIRTEHRWVGWDDPSADGRPLRFETPDGPVSVAPAPTVLALGGASWPRTGSDGSWVPLLESVGVSVAPLRAANCGFTADWTPMLRERFAYRPLKNVRISHRRPDGRTVSARGEAMLTDTGIEGGPVYALGAAVRATLDASGVAMIEVDLLPDLDDDRARARLSGRRPRESRSTWLRRVLPLGPEGLALAQESGPLPDDPTALVHRLRAVPVRVTGLEGVERAISCAGGVRWTEVDARLRLRAVPNTAVVGEMLDWEAPTGGYLLQAVFSTAVWAATHLLERS